MARLYQVPHHAFPWLMAGCLMAALPHLVAGPLWLSLVIPALVVWRILIQRGRMAMPGRWTRVAILLIVVAATLYSYGTLLGPKAGVCLLVAAFGLKTVEMFRLRDAYVVIVIAYFVLATVFLEFRDLVSTIYVIVALLMVTASLVGINHAESGVAARTHLKVAASLVLQALPLMLVLFILIPRIDPLWNLPSNEKKARTGMSDSMAPGEVTRLSLNDDLAFRVEFDGALPPPSQRYWRGLTFSVFDGRRWSQAFPRNIDREEFVVRGLSQRVPWMRELLATRAGPSYNYRVVMEPTQQRWLYALAVPFSRQPDLEHARDYRLVAEKDVRAIQDYRVTSYPSMARGLTLEEWEQRLYVSLPSDGNERARQMALDWHAEADSDSAYIQRLLGWFRDEAFYYTLEPPALGEHTVDDFLFGTRRGFCEHYTSAFTYLLRAAGIPARVVAGYQGGEASDVGRHLLIYQYDAHVWTEAWIKGRGWVKFDATAAVAPERIEFGLREAMARLGAEDELPGFALMRDSNLGRRLRHLADYMEFSWQKWVLGYEQSSQLELLSGLLGEVSPLRLAMALGGAAAVILGGLALWLFFTGRRPPLQWWQQEYWRMLDLLRRRGVDVSEQLGPRELATRGASRYPQAREALVDWCAAYEAVVYAGADQLEQDAAARRRLRDTRVAVRSALGRPNQLAKLR